MAGRATRDPDWIPPIAAARRIGISVTTLEKVAAPMGIRCRRIPGRHGRLYHAGDVEAAVAAMEARERAEVEAAQTKPPGPSRESAGRS